MKQKLNISNYKGNISQNDKFNYIYKQKQILNIPLKKKPIVKMKVYSNNLLIKNCEQKKNNENSTSISTLLKKERSTSATILPKNLAQKYKDKLLSIMNNSNQKTIENSSYYSPKNYNKTAKKEIKFNNYTFLIKDSYISELEKNINNDLLIYLKMINIYCQIELEINNIIRNYNNKIYTNDLYKALFELFNKFFENIEFFSQKGINFFVVNELNHIFSKIVKLLIVYYCLLFIILALLSIDDSIIIIKNQHEAKFKNFSKILFNAFYTFIYEELKLKNLFDTEQITSIENNFAKLNLHNFQIKYRTNFNSLKENFQNILSNLYTKVALYFEDVKELIKNLGCSSVSPISTSINQLIDLVDKKKLNKYINIINNVILYSLLNKNISIANKNIPKDKDIVYSTNQIPYLPPISNDKKYTLILGLDETLIYFFYSKISAKKDESHYGFFASEDNYDLFNNNSIENEDDDEDEECSKKGEILMRGMFLIRPYAKIFLEELSKYYEIVIFGNGTKEYCDKVIQILDLNNTLIKYRLYKQHISIKHINSTVKDLSLLGRNLNKTIIVDNIKDNFSLQPDNGLQIFSWKGDINDCSLKFLMDILKNIVVKNVKDVRKVIKKIKSELKKEKYQSYSKINVDTICI